MLTVASVGDGPGFSDSLRLVSYVPYINCVYTAEEMVPKKRKKPHEGGPGRVSEPKVAQSYRLSRTRIARAQAILGAPTATAAIEQALDAVVFRRELMDGVRSAFGIPIADAFPDATDGKRR